jgi:hypothetical protein
MSVLESIRNILPERFKATEPYSRISTDILAPTAPYERPPGEKQTDTPRKIYTPTERYPESYTANLPDVEKLHFSLARPQENAPTEVLFDLDGHGSLRRCRILAGSKNIDEFNRNLQSLWLPVDVYDFFIQYYKFLINDPEMLATFTDHQTFMAAVPDSHPWIKECVAAQFPVLSGKQAEFATVENPDVPLYLQRSITTLIGAVQIAAAHTLNPGSERQPESGWSEKLRKIIPLEFIQQRYASLRKMWMSSQDE